MFCSSCGKEINEKAVICIGRGCMVKNSKEMLEPQQKNCSGDKGLSEKSRGAILITMFVGVVSIFVILWVCSIFLLSDRGHALVIEFLLIFLILSAFIVPSILMLVKKSSSKFLKRFAVASIIVIISLIFVFIMYSIPWITSYARWNWGW